MSDSDNKEITPETEVDAEALAKAKAKAAAAAKAKAAAAAKARAAALAKQAGTESSEQTEAPKQAETAGESETAEAAEGDDAAKAKAIAVAKAKAAAAAKAKALAAAKAKEGGENEQPEEPSEPSPNQPMLDLIVKVITQNMGSEAIEKSYINKLSKDEPTLVIPKDKWHDVASLLREHPELSFEFLSTLQGVDYENRMEVVYSFLSFKNRGNRVTVNVVTDRDQASVPSVSDIWKGADWPERETYDLLGIQFTGHPNLKRIMLPDDWVGYPLRKDYVQLDEEV